MSGMEALQSGDPARLDAWLRTRLLPLDQNGPGGRIFSDFDLTPDLRPRTEAALKPAAVLAPIILRPAGWTMLFTMRAADLPSHAGQVSFPGGRLEAGDLGHVGAALRETQEEIGLDPEWIHPIGAGDAYHTVTGFCVRPIIALIAPGFTLRPDPREVAGVFEVPLALVLDGARYHARTQMWRGISRRYYVLDYPDHHIWGATAGMLKALCDRLWSEDDDVLAP